MKTKKGGETTLLDFYRKLDTIERIGKDIVIPDSFYDAIYLSERGDLFCYTGIHSKDKDSFFDGWPYYLVGKHSKDCKKHINGFFRIKNGCILLSEFVDHEFYNKKKYKSLSKYAVHLPVANSCYFGIQKRIETKNSWYFEENEELTRACFGLTFNELSYLTKFYAEKFGTYNDYVQFPRITRSMKNDNFCDITGIWIPPKFPYIAFSDSGYDFSHVSLFGFYRHIGALLSIGQHTPLAQLFKKDTSVEEIVSKVICINDYFPFERKVIREIVYGHLLR